MVGGERFQTSNCSGKDRQGDQGGEEGETATSTTSRDIKSGSIDPTFEVSPLPATAGTGNPIHIKPGETLPPTSSYTGNTIGSNVKTDKDSYEKSDAYPSATSHHPTFSVSPLPATGSFGNPVHTKPGDALPSSSSYTDNTIGSTVRMDKESYEKSDAYPSASSNEPMLGVAPLPATSGFGNPIHTRPGDPLPPTTSYTGNTIETNVKTDKASYERSDAYPTSQNNETLNTAGGVFGVPPVSRNIIPESSLPMGGAGATGMDSAINVGPTISSTAGPNTTTAALAGQVPLEPRGVPQVVQDSQEISGVPTEATESADALAHKDKMEQELSKKVPEQPATSEDYPTSKLASAAVDAAAAAGAAVLGGVAAAAGFASQKSQKAVGDIQDGKNPITGSGGLPKPDQVASAVPPQAAESFEKAHQSPEAAANPSAVANKSAVEHELERKVPTTNESSNPGPSETYTSALQDTAPSSAATGISSPVIADSDTMPAIALAHEETPAMIATTSAAPATSSSTSAGVSAAAGTAATAGITAHDSAFATDPISAPGHNSSSSTTSKPVHSDVETFKDDPTSATYASQATAAASHVSNVATGAGAAIAGIAAGGAAALGFTSAKSSHQGDKAALTSSSDPIKEDPTKAAYKSQTVNAIDNAKSTSNDYVAQASQTASGYQATAQDSYNQYTAKAQEATAPYQTKVADATNTASVKAKEAGAAVTGATVAGAAALGLTSASKKEQSAGKNPSGLNAPAEKPAQSTATGSSQLASASIPAGAAAPSAAAHSAPAATTVGAGSSMSAALRGREESRDVSPMSKGPVVTSGIDSAQTAQVSGWKQGSEPAPKSTPLKIKDSATTAASPSSTTTTASKEEKKKNRRSFFGRIKDKLKH